MSLNFSRIFRKKKTYKIVLTGECDLDFQAMGRLCNVWYRKKIRRKSNNALSLITYTAVMRSVNSCSDLRKTPFRNISLLLDNCIFVKQFQDGEQLWFAMISLQEKECVFFFRPLIRFCWKKVLSPLRVLSCGCEGPFTGAKYTLAACELCAQRIVRA